MKKIDFPIFSYIATTIIGILLMSISRLTNELFYAAIGGALIGTGISGIIEIFKKKSQYDDLSKIITSYLEPNRYISKEEDIKNLRRKWHLYWSTVSSSGNNFWNYATLDFSKKHRQGILETEFKIYNHDKNVFTYNLVAFKKRKSSPLVMIHESLDYEEAIGVYVFQDLNLSEVFYGFLYHMDWKKDRRISPTIMSTTPLTDKKNIKVGPLLEQDSKILSKKWNANYKLKTKMF